MTPDRQAIAQKLGEIEAELKRIGFWQEEDLPPEAYNITKPFGMGSMSGEQWLQFIFIPRVRKILGGEGEFPESSSISPWASKEFSGTEGDERLVTLLYQFDWLIMRPEYKPAPIPMPVPVSAASKYGFKTAEDKAREEDAAKEVKAKPVLAAWEGRISATLDEQHSLKQLAGEIAPKIEDVLWEWVAVNKGSLSDHFVTPDPFVACSANGANWAVFLHEDEEAFENCLWCVSLILDGTQQGNAPMLAVNSSRSALKDEAEGMAEILSNVTGIPARQRYGYGPNYMQEKSLHISDVLRGSPNIPVRPTRPQAYYRVHGEMKYENYFTLATKWIRLLPIT